MVALSNRYLNMADVGLPKVTGIIRTKNDRNWEQARMSSQGLRPATMEKCGGILEKGLRWENTKDVHVYTQHQQLCCAETGLQVRGWTFLTGMWLNWIWQMHKHWTRMLYYSWVCTNKPGKKTYWNFCLGQIPTQLITNCFLKFPLKFQLDYIYSLHVLWGWEVLQPTAELPFTQSMISVCNSYVRSSLWRPWEPWKWEVLADQIWWSHRKIAVVTML